MSTDALREALAGLLEHWSDEWQPLCAPEANCSECNHFRSKVEKARTALAAPASETLEKKYATGLQWAAVNPEDAKEMLEAIRPSETEKLPAKWRRQARVDCDPATGSERIHARGLAKDACADELEEALKKDKTNEQ